ncbi:MAG: YdbH domain-containing protein [Novosphingobium sp.]
MADDTAYAEDRTPLAPAASRRKWLRHVALALLVLAGVVLAVWLGREKIADRLIADELTRRGIPATYRIESIGANRQVLRDLVVGDPARPDFTAERVEVRTLNGWGMPSLGRITLVRPRLYGRSRDGKWSFGALDPLIFTDSKEPAGLPDVDLALIDGRARLDTDFGLVGIKAEGQGRLPDGFGGTMAAIVPRAVFAECLGENVSLFGKVTTSRGKARFVGPLRLDEMSCAKSELSLAQTAVQADVTIDPQFDGAEGRIAVTGGALQAPAGSIGATKGTSRFVWRREALTVHYDVAGQNFMSPQARLARLEVKGTVRTAAADARLVVEGSVSGGGLHPGAGFNAMLADLGRSGEGTLAAPIARQVHAALLREAPGSALSGEFVLRSGGGRLNLVVPQGRISGSSGQGLLTVSRLQLATGEGGSPRLSGNFQTGGRDLPAIVGRMERAPDGRIVARLAMAEYRAGTARVAVPQLTLVQAGNGALGFAGRARLTGDLPGGHARNLDLPVDGNWSSRGGLAVWRNCVPVRFDSLALANLTLERRAITLCPPPGRAIVSVDSRGTRIAAGAPSLAVAGRLGTTPVRINSGPFGMAWPGTLAARALDVELGPPATASRFRISNLTARLADQVSGRFAGADVRLAAVPLDLMEADGAWHFANGRLSIDGATFRLFDRERDARFQPLTSHDAWLQLSDNIITARAMLFHPDSDRDVVQADIRHDLGNGRGHADLVVPGIRFDQSLQPDMLSRLALGVIANTEGSVRGTGRIDWSPEAVTSTGRFSSDSLDFAAAFGPLKGMSGTVVFTDLLGMVTAPDQRLRIASINPGIEARDGTLSFQLEPGNVLRVNGASWPFLDGSLVLEPSRMVLGAAEVRRYTLVIEGLDAARFVEHLELANLAAQGKFDGRLPLVFDENGGRIENGVLSSRPPGGNLSYIGALTYKDLSPMGNFAFEALKSVDFRQMQIDMNGALTGEIITRVTFDGLSQGAGTRQNFLTRRIARLPLQFRINIRAPFFALFGSFRSLYDSSKVADPMTLGLVGKPPRVQPPDSEKL